MIENTNFTPQLSLPTKIPFVPLVVLSYKNIALDYDYVLNLVNKKSVQICFLSHHRDTYSISSILPVGPKHLKYLVLALYGNSVLTSGKN